jgi:hypothetical protein
MPKQIGGWSQTGERIQSRLDELHNRIQAKLDELHADFSSSKQTYELPTRRAHGPEKIKWKDSSERCSPIRVAKEKTHEKQMESSS